MQMGKKQQCHNSPSCTVIDRIQHFSRDCIECDGGCGRINPKKRCSQCHIRYYCSVQCQKKDWKKHKEYCMPIAEMITDDEIEQYDNEHNIPSIVPESVLNKECPICLEVLAANCIILIECNHAVCTTCVLEGQHYHLMQARVGEILNPEDLHSSAAASSYYDMMTCPLCRTKIKEGSIENDDQILEKAIKLETRAKAIKDKPELYNIWQKLLHDALMYLDQILQTTHPLITAYYKKAVILIELKQVQMALDVLYILVRVNNERLKHPGFKLAEEQDKAMENFDFKLFKELHDKMVDAVAELGLPAAPLRDDAIFEVYILQGRAYETLEQWDDAYSSYTNAEKSCKWGIFRNFRK
jgi:MYND finger